VDACVQGEGDQKSNFFVDVINGWPLGDIFRFIHWNTGDNSVQDTVSLYFQIPTYFSYICIGLTLFITISVFAEFHETSVDSTEDL